jgi:hypothetical protein
LTCLEEAIESNWFATTSLNESMLYYAFQNVDSFFLVNEFNKKRNGI